MYRPLPSYLTINNSEIEGLGLFSTDNIDSNFRIGITHIRDDRFQDGYIRTPLGGFFNHSENPNCRVVSEGDFIYLETIKPIKTGEELTAIYTLYKPKREENPQYTQGILELIENKINSNMETTEDIEKLNHFIAVVEKDYVLRIFKENNINSIEEYILERKKPFSLRNPNLSIVIGKLLAIVSFLKRN